MYKQEITHHQLLSLVVSPRCKMRKNVQNTSRCQEQAVSQRSNPRKNVQNTSRRQEQAVSQRGNPRKNVQNTSRGQEQTVSQRSKMHLRAYCLSGMHVSEQEP